VNTSPTKMEKANVTFFDPFSPLQLTALNLRLCEGLQARCGGAKATTGEGIGMNYSKNASLAICVAVVSFMSTPTFAAQDQSAEGTNRSTIQVVVPDAGMKNATQKGLPLTVTSNVSDQASVEAVLIPFGVARRIFGTDIAKNYAIVELIVSNRDSKAGLIIQSVFLDDRDWLPSGVVGALPSPLQLETTQKSNDPWQVASMESRLVRGQMLDAQQWTARNWTIRALTAVGTVAAGFQFPFTGDVAKGIAAFNGTVVPGASTLWPDGTVSQLNRISDFGFQTNKIIPKQSSDILVGFFPIDRFLSPALRKLFLGNPAAFFSPLELLNDPKTEGVVKGFMLPYAQGIDDSVTQSNLGSKMVAASLKSCAIEPTSGDRTCGLQDVMSRMSLNRVRVVIGGVMAVDVAAVPATIYDVQFNDGNTNPTIWTTLNQARNGAIHGVYLNGGTVSVVDETGAAIDGVSINTVSANSTDTQLAFTMTITKCLSPASKLYFVVSKSTATPGSTVPQSPASVQKATKAAVSSPDQILSSPYQFSLPTYTCPAPDGAGATGSATAPVQTSPKPEKK
jgi:hypothetical protein